jgi:hypothetical protein
MVRTRALVMLAETVAPVTTLRRCTHRLLAVFSMRRRVNSHSILVDVRAVLNKLRLTRRGRRRVCVDCQRCKQNHRKDDLCENCYVDFPCQYQCQAPLDLLLCLIRRAQNFFRFARTDPTGARALRLYRSDRLCRRERPKASALRPAGDAPNCRLRGSRTHYWERSSW